VEAFALWVVGQFGWVVERAFWVSFTGETPVPHLFIGSVER
jgi:hypothetical protein